MLWIIITFPDCVGFCLLGRQEPVYTPHHTLGANSQMSYGKVNATAEVIFAKVRAVRV